MLLCWRCRRRHCRPEKGKDPCLRRYWPMPGSLTRCGGMRRKPVIPHSRFSEAGVEDDYCPLRPGALRLAGRKAVDWQGLFSIDERVTARRYKSVSCWRASVRERRPRTNPTVDKAGERPLARRGRRGLSRHDRPASKALPLRIVSVRGNHDLVLGFSRPCHSRMERPGAGRELTCTALRPLGASRRRRRCRRQHKERSCRADFGVETSILSIGIIPSSRILRRKACSSRR